MRRKQIETENQSKDLEKLINATCEVYGINYNQLIGRWKYDSIAKARKTVMHIAAEKLGLPLRIVTKAVGKKDHTSAIHAIRSSRKLLNEKTYVADNYTEKFKQILCRLN